MADSVLTTILRYVLHIANACSCYYFLSNEPHSGCQFATYKSSKVGIVAKTFLFSYYDEDKIQCQISESSI